MKHLYLTLITLLPLIANATGLAKLAWMIYT